MILVDTSVWVDHFRNGDPALRVLLEQGRVVLHPFVLGELALGNLKNWHDTVATLGELPQLALAPQSNLIAMIADQALAGSGIGLVDAHLLLAAQANRGTRLWTRDKRLGARAEAMALRWAEA